MGISSIDDYLGKGLGLLREKSKPRSVALKAIEDFDRRLQAGEVQLEGAKDAIDYIVLRYMRDGVNVKEISKELGIKSDATLRPVFTMYDLPVRGRGGGESESDEYLGHPDDMGPELVIKTAEEIARARQGYVRMGTIVLLPIDDVTDEFFDLSVPMRQKAAIIAQEMATARINDHQYIPVTLGK